MVMERIIRFRGQNIIGEWHYGLLCHDKTKDTDYEWFISNSIGKPYAFGAIEKTIGQFTGLKDKNGLDIYEGDIIKTERNTVFVSFGKKEYNVKIYGSDDIIELNGWLVTNKNGDVETLDSSFCNGEIIGNIHENPEIIK